MRNELTVAFGVIAALVIGVAAAATTGSLAANPRLPVTHIFIPVAIVAGLAAATWRHFPNFSNGVLSGGCAFTLIWGICGGIMTQ